MISFVYKQIIVNNTYNNKVNRFYWLHFNDLLECKAKKQKQKQ